MRIGTKVSTRTGRHGKVLEVFTTMGTIFVIVLMDRSGIREYVKLESLTEVK